jgi:sodium/bile acid cotransporter 3/5
LFLHKFYSCKKYLCGILIPGFVNNGTHSCFAVMIPVWVLTLGRSIFPSDSVGIPYYRIARSSFTLFVPLAIGYAMQVYCKKVAKVMVRILKPLSILLIIFIIIFAIITNMYVFQLFTWQVIICLPFRFVNYTFIYLISFN